MDLSPVCKVNYIGWDKTSERCRMGVAKPKPIGQ